MDNQANQWYVIYTRPQYEKKIVSEIRFMNQHECYLPLKKVVRRWSDRLKKMEEPLFSNYVFVRSSTQNRTLLFDILGVLRFVSFEGKPVTVADEDIEKIKLMERNGNDLQTEAYGVIGSQVVIKEGVFAGLQGILIRKLNHSRLVVRMPLLKQAVSVTITENDLLYI